MQSSVPSEPKLLWDAKIAQLNVQKYKEEKRAKNQANHEGFACVFG